ncbi:Ribosomal protein S18 acetylase RimI [Chitinophaga eiseniae]|uniref:Ribosomal protein S18 acetylase RimI n=1 Tax=Chitinophaga eiseniae TaxID=634771 RepID=A0A1T4T1S1_9BACT|nr:GNAT family N-acetyltransferase [Chitinophaga eiseniae]SKA34118.1 Ribosomal protein S18 acetylase RimI [Chitinophaga eiseniae]
MEITVRKAVKEDLPLLLTFEQGIISEERPYDPTLQDGTIHYYDVAQMIAADHVEVAVAVAGNRLVGSGYCRIEPASRPYLKHDKQGYLGFMYVDPAFRGQGINAKIVAFLKEWAYLQDVLELRLDVYADNEAAVKAYEKTGFKKHLVEMRMDLRDDPTYLAQ